MKLKRLFAVLLAGVLLFSSCSKTDLNTIPNDASSNDSSDISDPMKQPTNTKIETPPATSYGYNFGEGDIDYSDGKMTLSPTLMGGETGTTVGFMVFIDGIPQMYTTETSSKPAYISNFNIEANSEKTHKLVIDAKVDAVCSKHVISVSSLLVPDFVPPLETPSFGNYHKILRNMSKVLSDEITDISSADEYKILKTENRVLTSEEKEEFNLGDEYGSGYTTECDLQQFERLENTFTLKGDESSLVATLCAYSTMPAVQDFRVTVFVNHKPVKINGDYDFIDVTMEGGKISQTEITLDNINIGDFVYCMAVPLVEGEMAMKSRSKIVISENNDNINENNTFDKNDDHASNSATMSNTENNSSNLENTGSSDQSNSTAGSSENPNNSDNNSSSDDIILNTSKLTPIFAIKNSFYANTQRDYSVYPALVKLNSNGEVEKTISNVYNANLHNDIIAVIKSGDILQNDIIVFDTVAGTTIMLLDEDLNVIKSLDISGIYGKFDFDEDRIVYVSENDREICCCDWNWSNHQTLLSLSNDQNGAEYFVDIKLGDGFVALNAQGKVSGADADFYGICDFSGNYEINRKDGINHSQVYGKTAVWGDRHTNVVGGVMPSGEIIIYQSGNFQSIKTENILESQDVFLTGENEFFTALGDDYAVVKQYSNGIKSGEIFLGAGNDADIVIRIREKVFVNVFGNNETFLKSWEMS